MYVYATVIFFYIDILWLGFISKDMYKDKIGQLLKVDVNWTAAILFYLFFIVGLLFFVIDPALTEKDGNTHCFQEHSLE